MADEINDWVDVPLDDTEVDDWVDVPLDEPTPQENFKKIKELGGSQEQDNLLRRFAQEAVPFGLAVPASGLVEAVSEEGLGEGLSAGIGALPGMSTPVSKEAKEAFKRGMEKQQEAVRAEPTRAGILATLGGGVAGAGISGLTKAAEMPFDVFSEGLRAASEGAGPLEIGLRAGAAPVLGGLGGLSAKLVKAIPGIPGSMAETAVNKTLASISKRIQKDFGPEQAKVITEMIEKRGSDPILSVIKERGVDPKKFFESVAKGDKDALTLVDDIANTVAKRASEGIERINSQMIPRSQEDILEAAKRQEELVKSRADLVRRRQGLQETGEEALQRTQQSVAYEEQMEQLNNQLKDTRSQVRLALQRAEAEGAEGASRIAKEELIPLAKNMRKQAANMEKEAVAGMYDKGIPNMFGADEAKAFRNKVRSEITLSLPKGDPVRKKLVEMLKTASKSMSRAELMGEAWSSLRNMKERLNALKSNDRATNRVLSQVRRIIDESLYTKPIADIPQAEQAIALYKEAYDVQNTAKRLVSPDMAGRGVQVDPTKARATLGRSPEAPQQIEGLQIPEEAKQTLTGVSERARMLPEERKLAVETSPEVAGVEQQIAQARRSARQQKLTEAQKQAARRAESQKLARESVDFTEQTKLNEIARKAEEKIANLDMQNQTKQVQDSVNAMLRGDDPGPLGRSAMKLRTGVTDADIDAVIASRQARDQGATAELEALGDVSPELMSRVITPEDFAKAVETSKIATSPENRQLAKVLVSGRDAKKFKDKAFARRIAETIGVGAASLMRIPLLGTAVIREVNSAMKTDKAIDAVTNIANILKVAEERGIDVKSPLVTNAALDALAKITGTGTARAGTSETLRNRGE